MSRIVTVYSDALRPARLEEMAQIRWYRISAALADLGHAVDIASSELLRRIRGTPERLSPNLRIAPIARVRWGEFDVVKTLFHSGFEMLERHGGSGHPFIIAKLGSVVGPTELPGIYFYGKAREQLFGIQERIARTARYVTLLSQPAVDLWRQCFPGSATLLVPGAAEEVIPAPGHNPYPRDGRVHCVFSGNFYSRSSRSQPEAHRTLVDRLNRLGRALDARGARLHVVGPGDRRSLDHRHLTYHPPVGYQRSWDYLHFASVGVVVAAGPFMHNNESTKIYHYLRAGLPMVSEAGFPNDDVVRQSGLGFVVENGRLDLMADRILEAAHTPWDRAPAIRYMLEHHTWRQRALVYDRILRDPAIGARPGPGAAR